MKQLAPNSMVQNRYLVVQMIGKGGMGEVYLAVDQRLGSAVALKRTFFGETGGAMTDAFEREAKILGRLRHPVLPKVIDHFSENGGQFLVMEHISGDDLAKRLESAGKPFPLSWVMFWADQLLDALAYLHSHEPPIIHRDIKPQNLKLTDENHIVLLDFGLSKDFDTALQNEPPGTGSVVGYSPHFASMEQVHGGGTDARSDLYSLSATLYQLMTDTVPPDALTRADAMLGGGPDPLKSVSSINSEVPEAISDVIVKGLSVRKDDRFATATEMQKALRRAFNKPKSAQKSEAVTPTEAKTAIMPGLGATLPQAQSSEAGGNGASQQSDVKTEVLKAPDTESIEPTPAVTEQPAAASPPPTPMASTPTPPVAAQDDTADLGEETMPAGYTKQQAEKAAAAAAAAPAAAAAQASPKKKSRAGLFIGGLLAILLLGGIAGGGGWYAYKKYYAKGNAAATPTPSPQPSSTVIAESTPGGNSNSNTVAETNTNTATTDSNTASDNPTGPTRTGTTTPPTTGKNNPTRPNTPPAAKPQPKPKSTDRTIILQ
ncbi:MAG: serine/threonine protein kinase [Acidobacteria bacterium]|nr:serine/threonine protein kinase [Acidobacteriota bacterium]